MTFVREKRLLLGALAFLAVLPLPFNEPRPQGVSSDFQPIRIRVRIQARVMPL